jgi:hypothetical protein
MMKKKFKAENDKAGVWLKKKGKKRGSGFAKKSRMIKRQEMRMDAEARDKINGY